jgi:hypothetical protein
MNQYKVLDCIDETEAAIEEKLNALAVQGWSVVTASVTPSATALVSILYTLVRPINWTPDAGISK